jgi:hypothetical protein
MIKSLATGMVIGLGLFVFADYAMSIPDVHMSHSTKTCITVENYPSTFFGTSNYSCENMPAKFNHVWVQ